MSITTLLTIVSIIAASVWLYFFYQAYSLFKTEYKLRGIVKFFTLEMVAEEMKKKVSIWLIITAIFSVIPCIWAVYLSWKTDYSFMVGLFPIVWYYTLTRYFFLEKKDLT